MKIRNVLRFNGNFWLSCEVVGESVVWRGDFVSNGCHYRLPELDKYFLYFFKDQK